MFISVAKFLGEVCGSLKLNRHQLSLATATHSRVKKLSEESCELVLLGGSEFCNRKGETVFKFKRKTYDGQTYYLFETHYDRMEPTDISKFDLVFGIIKKVASDFDIPFYDSAELNEKLKKALDEYIKNHGVDELIREQKDFDIPLIDVATGDLKKLTVGIQLTKNYKP